MRVSSCCRTAPGTLDYFALRDDKRYFFVAGDAMLAYRCLGGYALVSGDPIGDPAAFERLLREFFEHCRAARPARRLPGRARGRPRRCTGASACTSVYLGDEAVLHCDTFSLAAAHKSVRSAVTRVGRECSFRMLRETEASGILRDALNELRERWRDGSDERGFTMELGGGVRGEDPGAAARGRVRARRPAARVPAADALLRRRSRAGRWT